MLYNNNLQIVPYKGNNLQIVPYNENNLQIVPYNENNLQIVPYRGNNLQIVPYNENNLQIVPYRGNNLQIVPYNENILQIVPYAMNNLQIVPYTGNSPSISNIVTVGVEQEEAVKGQSFLKAGAERAGKAVSGLFSFWITNACVAETFGATCALLSSTTAAGTVISGLGVVVFATAAVATGKMGIDLFQGKSFKQSFEDSVTTAKTTTKAVIEIITNPLHKLIGSSNEKTSPTPLLAIEQ